MVNGGNQAMGEANFQIRRWEKQISILSTF